MEAEAEIENENQYWKFGSCAIPPVPVDAPVSRTHYNIWEVL